MMNSRDLVYNHKKTLSSILSNTIFLKTVREKNNLKTENPVFAMKTGFC